MFASSKFTDHSDVRNFVHIHCTFCWRIFTWLLATQHSSRLFNQKIICIFCKPIQIVRVPSKCNAMNALCMCSHFVQNLLTFLAVSDDIFGTFFATPLIEIRSKTFDFRCIFIFFVLSGLQYHSSITRNAFVFCLAVELSTTTVNLNSVLCDFVVIKFLSFGLCMASHACVLYFAWIRLYSRERERELCMCGVGVRMESICVWTDVPTPPIYELSEFDYYLAIVIGSCVY